eukprot:TRINITY_DN938_c0_g1_i1.p1 TRINITY_DN938_c0_g1~~TRINITY_DN938_c0_g1_i1.p1  ORF type:complete len:167 (+),score=48.88 TRINITY_DN938_c0_g1_i1:83-583(+)
MARIAAFIVAAGAALVTAEAFVSPYASAPSNRMTSTASATPRFAEAGDTTVDTPASSFTTFMAAAMAGLLIGLAQSQVASAAGLRPTFSLVRPDYMQGIDAALAATKPGEVDFVTRSQMEMSMMPETIEEFKKESDILKSAPSKEVRVKQQLEHLRELAKVTPILS